MANFGAVCTTCETYLVLYGSGFLSPIAGESHNTGNMFQLAATARHKINQENFPEAQHRLFYCPIDWDFFNYIGMFNNIVRLDIYTHAWAQGLNLGGFTGVYQTTRKVYKDEKYKAEEPCWGFFTCEVEKIRQVIADETIELQSDKIDWSPGSIEGDDLRHVNIKDLSNSLKNLKSSSFNANQETYLWGCNAGGQLDPNNKHILQNAHAPTNRPLIEDPKLSFAQKLGEIIGKGKVYALVGKGWAGGSMFKTDATGKPVYSDGEMIPANIHFNNKGKNTKNLKAKDYMKEFPI